jgi:VIT1/CCC1 family predicted Fe2+/Mn2+ transporter
MYSGAYGGTRGDGAENPWKEHIQELQASFEEAKLRNRFWIKFAVAMIGGTFLIVPMLIMTLHNSLTTSLVTVSVAVILFALAIVLSSEVTGADPSQLELVVSTAAYAAVLVVFVGTNNQPSQ